LLANIEVPGNSSGIQEAKRTSAEISAYIETGAMTESARVGPSSLGRTGASPVASEVSSMRALSGNIQRSSQEFLPDPSNATPEHRRAAAVLAFLKHVGVPGVAYIASSAQTIAGYERSFASGGNPDMRGTLRKLGQAIGNGFSAVTKNEFTNPWATTAASVANVTLRNTASVFLPTFTRQMLSAQVERAIVTSGMSEKSTVALGSAFAALPMVLLIAGTIRAHQNPEASAKAKTEGNIARGIMGVMAFAALLGGIFGRQFGDKSSGAAAQMVAFTLYTFMRDIVSQSHIRLKNPNMEHREPGAKPVPDALHWALISVLYGIDQIAVNQFMPTAAPVSGPGSFLSHMGGADQAKAAAIRAGINLGGEIGDDLLFNGIAAVRDKKALRLGLNWEPNLRHVANGLLAPMAVRTAINHTNVVFGNLIDKALGSDQPLLSKLLPAITMGGLLNGIFYWPFANAGVGLPKVKAPGHAQVEESVFPNVDMSDSRSVLGVAEHRDDGPNFELPTRTSEV
jgi:hypothetical protein